MKKKFGSAVLRILILLVVLVLAFFILRYYLTTRESISYSAPLTPVRTVSASLTEIDQSLSFKGYIESSTMVPIVPFVSGTILEYDIDQGSFVNKDDVVARIDSRPYELQYAQAEAQTEALESAYERMNSLYQSNAVTLQELESIRAQRDAAQAQKELAELQLSYADVKAPVSGTVVINKGGVGSIASNTDFIAIVADLDDLIVNLNVSAAYYDTIMNSLDDLEITVLDESRGLSSSASLVSTAPYIDPLSRNFSLKIRLDDPHSFILGSAVDVKITYDKAEGVYAIPSSVLRLDGSLYYVEDGTAKMMSYKPRVANDEMMIVPDGMENAAFVIEGQNSLFDGQSVRVLED